MVRRLPVQFRASGILDSVYWGRWAIGGSRLGEYIAAGPLQRRRGISYIEAVSSLQRYPR